MNDSWKRWKTVLLLSVTLCAPGFMAASCFNKVAIPVNIEKSVEFDVDVDKYVKPALDKKGIKSTDGKIPAGAPPISIPVSFAQLIDISQEKAITSVGKYISEVNVKSMLVSAINNTLTTSLPGFDILMGPKDAKIENFDKVANLSGIPKGKTGELEDLIKSGASTATMSKHILKMAFQVGVKTTLTLKAGDTIPAGKAKLKVNLKLQVKVTPFKK